MRVKYSNNMEGYTFWVTSHSPGIWIKDTSRTINFIDNRHMYMGEIITKSSIYPGKPITRRLYLFGVEIADLKTFASIIKTNKELTLKEFKAMFTGSVDGYDAATIEDAFNMVEPLKSEDIFGEQFNNSELRAAIIKYCNPEVVFGALKHKVIDKLTLTKRYPRIKTKGKYGKPDSTDLLREDIIVEYVQRTEEYELLSITDKRLTQFLPWSMRTDIPILILKMCCPSSGKLYYEYIDPRDIKLTVEEAYISRTIHKGWFRKEIVLSLMKYRTRDLRNTGEIVKQAIAWQMRTQAGTPITQEQYNKIISET